MVRILYTDWSTRFWSLSFQQVLSVVVLKPIANKELNVWTYRTHRTNFLSFQTCPLPMSVWRVHISPAAVVETFVFLMKTKKFSYFLEKPHVFNFK